MEKYVQLDHIVMNVLLESTAEWVDKIRENIWGRNDTH